MILYDMFNLICKVTHNDINTVSDWSVIQLFYEQANVNDKNHIEILNYHLFAPTVTSSNNVVNTKNKTAQDYINMLQNSIHQYQIIYLINDLGEKEYIGTFRFIPYDIEINSILLAYSIIPAYQNKKLGSRIPPLSEQYLQIKAPHIKTIYANTFNNNIASQKILLKNGYEQICHNDINATKLNTTVINKHDTLKELYNNIDNNQQYLPTVLFKKTL